MEGWTRIGSIESDMLLNWSLALWTPITINYVHHHDQAMQSIDGRSLANRWINGCVLARSKSLNTPCHGVWWLQWVTTTRLSSTIGTGQLDYVWLCMIELAAIVAILSKQAWTLLLSQGWSTGSAWSVCHQCLPIVCSVIGRSVRASKGKLPGPAINHHSGGWLVDLRWFVWTASKQRQPIMGASSQFGLIVHTHMHWLTDWLGRY